MAGKRQKPSRWTITHAASEWDIHASTLSKRIKTAGIAAGKDGMFSTKQIDAAKNGDLPAEKLRLTREQADKLALENAEKRGHLIDLTQLAPVINKAIASIKAEIDGLAYVEREDKDRLMLKCGELWDKSFEPTRGDEADLEPAGAV